MAGDSEDLYQRFEREVRAPRRRMLLDAFLPPPESLESAVAPPAPPPLPEPSPEEAGLLARLDGAEPPPEPRPKPAKKRRAAPVKKKEAPLSLQEEIAEFMNRDQTALSPDDDIDAFLKNSLDPNVDPEPDK